MKIKIQSFSICHVCDHKSDLFIYENLFACSMQKIRIMCVVIFFFSPWILWKEDSFIPFRDINPTKAIKDQMVDKKCDERAFSPHFFSSTSILFFFSFERNQSMTWCDGLLVLISFLREIFYMTWCDGLLVLSKRNVLLVMSVKNKLLPAWHFLGYERKIIAAFSIIS